MFVCTHRGTSSVESVSPLLDPAKVQFVLVRIPLGSGSLSRTKFVYVHFSGSSCPVVQRARWNSVLGDAMTVLNTNNGIQIDNPAEMTLDNILAKLEHVFVVDSGSYTIAQAKLDIARRIQEESERVDGARSSPTPPKQSPRLALELGLNESSILKALGDDDGPINWVIYNLNAGGATTTLLNAGGGGIPEMSGLLEDDAVQFGLLRLAFGIGRFRRTKRIFFQWAGDSVSAMEKGKAAAAVPDMVERLGHAHAEIQLFGRESLDVGSIVRTVEPFFVVDAIELAPAGKASKRALSEGDYLSALGEEQGRFAAFYQQQGETVSDSPPANDQPTTFPVKESVSEVHRGRLLWCIIQPRK